MFLYRIISIIIFPLLVPYIFLRAMRGKEDIKRIKERFAHPSIKASPDMFWIHAVSVGETNSALIFVEEILKTYPKISILFTTTTRTSAAILANKVKDFQGRVIHQFLPVDSYFVVKKFLNYWQPKKIFFVESEIWPNFIDQAASLDIPVFLINGRMSQKSFDNWKVAKEFQIKIFDKFKIIFAQSLEDQQRFMQLTKNKVLFFGNLKSQAANLKFDENELLKLKDEIAQRRFWIAASTHQGEEEIAIEVHKKLREKFPDLLTIIVLRHPHRAEEIKELCKKKSLNFVQRSAKEKITNSCEIFLVDSLGEMGLFYSLADFAFVGASLVELGGHNPFEPIKLNCAVITGPHVFNFKEIYEELRCQNACIFIKDSSSLAVIVENFLQNKESSKLLSDKAFNVIKDSQNITQKIIERL